MTDASTVGALWQPLLQGTEWPHQGAPATRDALLEQLLGGAVGRPPPSAARSGLNSDGMPLQWCTSLRPGAAERVLIGDPHSELADPRARLAGSVERARALPGLLGCTGLDDLVESTLARVLPGATDDPGLLPRGGLWLAACLQRPVYALYACAAWGTDLAERWSRIEQWFDAVLPDSREARAVVQRLRLAATPECACIEGTDPASARAKVYFRLRSAEVPDVLRQRLLEDPRIAQFLRIVLGDRGVPPSALTFGYSFRVRDGAFGDAKVDVCGHCVQRPAAQWQDRLDDVGAAFAMDVDAARPLLAWPGFGLSLIGAGIQADGAPRVNVYGRMRAPLRHDAAAARGQPEASCARVP